MAKETSALTDPRVQALGAGATLAETRAADLDATRAARIDESISRKELSDKMAGEYVDAYLPVDPRTGKQNEGTVRMRDLLISGMQTGGRTAAESLALARYQNEITKQEADVQNIFMTSPKSSEAIVNAPVYNRTAESPYAWVNDNGRVIQVPLPYITLQDGTRGQLRANQAMKAAKDANMDLEDWLDLRVGADRWRRSSIFSNPLGGAKEVLEGTMPGVPGAKLPES